MARGLKFRIQEKYELYYLCCENNGANQLRGYRLVELNICMGMSIHDAAQRVLLHYILCSLSRVHDFRNPFI